MANPHPDGMSNEQVESLAVARAQRGRRPSWALHVRCFARAGVCVRVALPLTPGHTRCLFFVFLL